MDEATLLKRFILNCKATNQEHIEAINWVNSLAQKAEQNKQQTKTMKDGEQ